MKGAVVIGGHVQGLGIIRILGKHGIPCYLLDNTSVNVARHSRYCKKFFKIPDSSSLVEFLVNLSKMHNLQDWMVIPTNDRHVKELSQNKLELEQYFKVCVDCWESIEKCYNKKQTYQLAQQQNIPIPKTFFPQSIEDLQDIEIPFPCIIKPAVMHLLYEKTKKKVIVCNNKEDLIRGYIWVQSIIPKDDIIVQEIIPGDSEQQYSACFFFDRTKPYVSLLAKRKRQIPPDFGKATTFAETVHEPHVIMDQAILLLKCIHYWGLCEVEFKKDTRDNEYKLLEVNPRTWKWHSIANRSGSPFLISIYNSIYFNEPITKNDWEKAYWRDLITDVLVNIKTQGLVKSFNSINNYESGIEDSVFDRSDVMPFLFELLYLPIIALKR